MRRERAAAAAAVQTHRLAMTAPLDAGNDLALPIRRQPPWYERARVALAEAVKIDEVRQIHDLAAAAQEYARRAKDSELIDNATEIRVRAERRAGEVLAEMKARGERDAGGRGPVESRPAIQLKDLEVTPSQSSRWQRKAAMPKEEFEQHLAAAKKAAVASLDKAATQAEKRERRADRERELAEKTLEISAALGAKLYGVIYADPPWRFEPYSRDSGMDRAADNHYPTEHVEKLKALEVPAAEDAVLFLWATVPMLPQALEVMRAWGFTYKSNFAWVKHKAGTGYWNRNQHELLLVGTRGDIPAPAPGQQFNSVIEARSSGHSAKPFRFREMIEAMFPLLPRIELFARTSYTGWDRWGNEAEVDDAA